MKRTFYITALGIAVVATIVLLVGRQAAQPPADESSTVTPSKSDTPEAPSGPIEVRATAPKAEPQIENRTVRFAPMESGPMMERRDPTTGTVIESRPDSRFTPIPLTDLHRKSLHHEAPDGTTALRQHMNLELQSRDDSWATGMEQQLAGFFSTRGAQSGIEVAVITCRSRQCEIQAFSDSGPEPFQALIDAARVEAWWDFSNAQPRSSPCERRTCLFLYLDRAKK